MTLAATVILAWGILVGVFAVVLWVWTPDRLPPSLLSGVAFAALLLAAYLQLRRPGEPPVRLVADLSVGPVLLGLGAAMMLNGVAFGLWLVLAGAGVFAVGLVALLGELRSARRART
jgi:hypothetical protein